MRVLFGYAGSAIVVELALIVLLPLIPALAVMPLRLRAAQTLPPPDRIAVALLVLAASWMFYGLVGNILFHTQERLMGVWMPEQRLGVLILIDMLILWFTFSILRRVLHLGVASTAYLWIVTFLVAAFTYFLPFFLLRY